MQKAGVLVVGGGIFQCYMIQEAQAMGLHVYCTDIDAEAPGRRQAETFFQIDTYDEHQHYALGEALRGKIVGVVTCGADVSPSVAAAAEGAQVWGIPRKVARLTHDKSVVRLRLSMAGLDQYQPRFTLIRQWEDMPPSLTYPLVIKPLQQCASRGVTIVHSVDDVQRAFGRASIYEPACLVEEYLQGTEHSAEMIFDRKGYLVHWHIVDRLFDYTDGIPIEQGHINPTELGSQQQDNVLAMLLRCANALGVTQGVFKGDILYTLDGPKLLECTTRLSGGLDSQWSCPAVGLHPMRVLLCVACDLLLPSCWELPRPQGYAAVAAMLPKGREGTIRHIPVLKDVEGHEVVWSVRPGESLHPLEHNAQRLGYVCSKGDSYQGAWRLALARADFHTILALEDPTSFRLK